MRKQIFRRPDGFSLLELMIAVTIVGVLAAVALPSFSYMVRNNCMTTAATELVISMQFARSEAIKRRADVNITAGLPGGAAGPDTNEWGGGWHVWFDTNADGNYDANEELRVSALNCLPVVDETSADRTNFIYGSDGFINTQGAFDVCVDNTGENGRQINISTTGRPKTAAGITCN